MLDRPWARVKNPTPIPEDVGAGVLSGLGEQEFAELIRDNLVPRMPAVPRARWEQLWKVLLEDDVLADRAFDVLEEFLDAIEAFKAAEEEPEETERKRISKFETQVQGAWSRLERTELPAAAKIRTLSEAILTHREQTLGHSKPTKADRELWRMLGRIGLDSKRSDSGK